MVGEKTIENPGRSEGEHGSSESASDQARRVAKADELRRMANDDLVAVMGNISIKSKKPFRLTGEGKARKLEFL